MAKKKIGGVDVLNADLAEQQKPDLPPAGTARDEEFAQRKDKLAEAAESSTMEKIDPKALEPDRELQYLLQEQDALAVTDARKGFAYCWVYTGQHGQMVTKKKSKGWEVVQGNDPESKDHKSEDTTRRVGDTILMRISLERYDQLARIEEIRRQRQEEGVTSELIGLGEKHANKGFIVRTGEDALERVRGRSTARHEFTKQMATKGIDRMLRDGTVPGLPKS